ncbi:hypothetical protein P153DRAFT_34703 [Dothidotthia symphoricarpi CBS 119687]|uniref:SAC3/GANP/THP3 conserved domain-containing protein n=1 Tax=Dothidotthia symphoricarpi CBS 119687 TaxID=1392245 RepID=A0A6A6ABC1_9PLEO|nr:uncharacterized protein P153DRAFT_34703 [Dothidotthia symphoricarpi CBS 119687]KAF2128314.1 hypothetical protein P153DRAFT_34703 [Dothidotthia symphoricarpi CBS 119687]
MNPDGQMKLSESVKLYGDCTDMCPEFERVRRIVELDVKAPECTPETEYLPRKERIPDESRMVKAYARSAAGMDVELISEIRSPATCLKTIDHLMQRLDTADFDHLHSWIWDRTRAVRKDLRTQRIEKRPDINILLTCLERSARFLLLSMHHMAQSPKESYTYQQDMEQFNQTLMSLKERYTDNRRAGIPSDNEAEFWAYRLILASLFANTQLESELHSLPSDLRHNNRVKTAIEIGQALKSVLFKRTESKFIQAQANWKRFWELVKSSRVSYLMACAAEVSFQRVRHVVLDTIWRAYRRGNSKAVGIVVDDWTTDKLKYVLGLDTDREAVELCEAFGFTFSRNDEGHTYLDIIAMGYGQGPLRTPADASPQIFSADIVESKRFGRALSAVISGMSVQEARRNGLVFESDSAMQVEDEMEDETSLFVPDTTTAKSNGFFPAANGAANLSAFAPSFSPASTPATTPAASFASGNPFAQAVSQTQPNQVSASPFSSAVQPGLFDAAKTPIQFAPNSTQNTNPFAKFASAAASKPESSTPATSFSNEATATPSFSFANAAKTEQPTATSASQPPASFGFSNNLANGGAAQNATKSPFSFATTTTAPAPAAEAAKSSFSFTPATSPTPTPAAPVAQDEEKQKAEEEQRKALALQQQQAAEEQQRVQAEQERQAQEAEQRRIENQRRQQQLDEERRVKEERERVIREEQRLAQKEEERLTKARERETAYNTLTMNILFDPDEGLMYQFLENAVDNVTRDVLLQVQREKATALGEEFNQRKQLGFKRAVMAHWIAQLEKKHRARQARDRRRRLKELRAQMANEEEGGAPATMNGHATSEPTFKKPATPNSRRARRTEERRSSQAPEPIEQPAQVQVQAWPPRNIPRQAPSVQTPATSVNGTASLSGYSEAYEKSTVPSDRTETDWFKLRALGIDPSKYRKRSFGSSSGEEERQEVKPDPKRPRRTPPIASPAPSPSPTPTITDDPLARFRALQHALHNSASSAQSVNGTASFNGRSSLNVNGNGNGKASQLIAQAKQLLATPKQPPTHDFGRSVPNLSLSRQSAFNRSTATTGPNTTDRPAYWARTSRFVPQHLYGKGPDAIRRYRDQYAPAAGGRNEPMAISSPASARNSGVQGMSSPIPTQMSYFPLQTQTQYGDGEPEVQQGGDVYSELDDSDDDVPEPEVVHAQVLDSSDDEEEESEEEEDDAFDADEDEDAVSFDEDEDLDEDEDEEMPSDQAADWDDEEDDSTPHFAQPAQGLGLGFGFGGQAQQGFSFVGQAQGQGQGQMGGTQDDAIELSD